MLQNFVPTQQKLPNNPNKHTSMIFLDELQIKSLLTWDDTLKATETAMKAVSEQKSAQAQRVFSQIFDSPKWMLTMPGYLEHDTYGGWACKILTGNPKNVNLPTPRPAMNANIVFFDQETGALKAVFSGLEITNWRTAAASAIATKYLHTAAFKPQKILAIFGCGDQGRAHANCFYNCFQFEEIRLWNRTSQRAVNLAKELNETFNTSKFKAVLEKENCAKGADVIITTTSPGPIPLVEYKWLKPGVHINAVGVISSALTEKHYELHEEIYRHAEIYIDNWPGANKELAGLKVLGDMKAEIGEVILGKCPAPNAGQLTVFQSLGMASEDCAMARLIYDLHMKKEKMH